MGPAIVNVVRPGAGLNVDVRALDAKAVAAYTGPGKMMGAKDFLSNVIPATLFGSVCHGEYSSAVRRHSSSASLLQHFSDGENPVLQFIEKLSPALFRIVAIIMELLR